MRKVQEVTTKIQKVKVIPCEIYLKDVIYHKPVIYWHPEKQEKFKKRKVINLTILKKIKKFCENHANPSIFL